MTIQEVINELSKIEDKSKGAVLMGDNGVVSVIDVVDFDKDFVLLVKDYQNEIYHK